MAQRRAMSIALFFSYGFVAVFVTLIMVLFCLGCHCSVPLRKIWIWLFSMPCCRRCVAQTEAKEKRQAQAEQQQARSTEADYQKCFTWVPFLLTCGYCFGQCTEEMEGGAAPLPPLVAQPVAPSEVDESVEVVGTEAVVSIHMPLLRF